MTKRENDRQTIIEDLAVDEGKAEEVKGGAQLWGEGKKVAIDFCKTN